MYSTTNFRKGLKIEIEGKPYVIIDFQHVKPGKGGAFVRTKIKNLESGQVLEQTFRAGIKVDRPDLEQKKVQYLYQDGEQYVFMDTKTYDQVFVGIEYLDNVAKYLVLNIEAELLYYKGRPIDIEIPSSVIMTVINTEPGVRGDTATGVTKPATMETGLVLNVPLFIEEGEKLKVDTRTGEYIERA